MISQHQQFSTTGWNITANTLANGGFGHGKVVKILFGVERALEIHNGKVFYRWVGVQPLPWDKFEEHAERWIRQFVDESFLKVAHAVDFINGYNETLANSQSKEERLRWIALHTAMAKVWKERFRDVEPRLQHIKIVLCETAVGNDIPIEIAAASVKYDALLGYHPYIACDTMGPVVPDNEWSGISRPPYVSPHDWRWYSGRWNWMDMAYSKEGVNVTWAFGEMGPVWDASHNWSGHLDPIGGWKNCLSGSITRYQAVMKYWLDNATKTNAYHDGRIEGAVLFTSGAPGNEGQWATFDLRDKDLNDIISFTNNYPYPEKLGTITPPPPVEATCEPRVQYRREYRCLPAETGFDAYMAACADAFFKKATIGFSYDDAGVGKLDDKTAVLFGLESEDVPNFVDWYREYYPGTKLSLKALPEIGRTPPGLELRVPVEEPFVITQVYGENYTEYMNRYGVHGHNGIDYARDAGYPIYLSADGTLVRIGEDTQGYGNFAVVSHGDGAETLYAHLQNRTRLILGKEYKQGMMLGTIGSTGHSTGPHLHFGLKIDGMDRDPAEFIV